MNDKKNTDESIQFDKPTLERMQLEQDIKTLLRDLENAKPKDLETIGDRLKALQSKRNSLEFD